MQSSKPKDNKPYSSVTFGTTWPDEERATRSEERDNPATKKLAPQFSLLAPSSARSPQYATHLRRTGDVPTAPIEWLWPNRIPLGKVTLLVGDPGLGKSLLALDLAAIVSKRALARRPHRKLRKTRRPGDSETGRRRCIDVSQSPSLPVSPSIATSRERLAPELGR